MSRGATDQGRDVWTGVLLGVLGLGLALNSLLGPLVLNVIHYRVTHILMSQTIGLDAVSLVVVAPLALAAGVLTFRGHQAGPALGLAVGSYTTYMFVQYVVGPEYLRLAGNNERFFPLYLALFILGGVSGIRAWNALDPGRLPTMSRRRTRIFGRVVLPLAALLAFSRYIAGLTDAMSAKPEGADYLGGPHFFWTIALLDLGVGLPAIVAACLGLLRARPWALKATYAVVGWLALVGAAVGGMALTMYVRDESSADVGSAAMVVALALVFISLAVVVYRPLFGPREVWS